MVEDLRKEIEKTADPEKGRILQRFFSVEDRARGDIFKGLTVPQSRIIANKYRSLSLDELADLLNSDIHEERIIALFILVNQFQRADDKKKEEIYKFYLKNTKFVNHWDLVDSSAHQIVGEFLQDKQKDILYKLVKSRTWWERRIGVIATLAFIKKRKFNDTFKIAQILISDRHDLIHKAVGWMLRETYKKGAEKELTDFLKKNYSNMPRTMLRYSIEKFPKDLRKKYLSGNF